MLSFGCAIVPVLTQWQVLGKFVKLSADGLRQQSRYDFESQLIIKLQQVVEML